MGSKKKGAVGKFEVWHVSRSLYEVRRGGEFVARADSLNAAYERASRLNRDTKAAEKAAREIEEGLS